MTIEVNHIEIPILDLEKAKTFYDSVFDWNLDLESMPNYGLADIRPVSLGFPLVEKIPEHGINVIFGVSDIDKLLETIVANGGKVHMEKYQVTPEVGYAAEFLDCFGNRLGLISPPEK